MSRFSLSSLIARLLPSPPSVEPGEEVVFVDVRTMTEWRKGHVAGARHIPHDQMPARWRELRQHRQDRVLLYCRSGARSGTAARVLRAQGFERAENAGGLGGLRRAGFPIVTDV